MRTTKETRSAKVVHVARKHKDSMRMYVRSDPEHGWLAVSRKLISKFGLTSKISAKSYQRKSVVFLDRNKDMPTFVKAAEKHGLTLNIIDLHTNRNSKILGYKSYTPRDRDRF